MSYKISHENLHFTSEAPLPSIDVLLSMFERHKQTPPDQFCGVPEDKVFDGSPQGNKFQSESGKIGLQALEEGLLISCLEELEGSNEGESEMVHRYLETDQYVAETRPAIAALAKSLGLLADQV